MILEPKKFKKVILVGLDLDLVSELKKNKILIEGYTSANPKKNSNLEYLGSIYDSIKIKKSTGILLADSDINLKKTYALFFLNTHIYQTENT